MRLFPSFLLASQSHVSYFRISVCAALFAIAGCATTYSKQGFWGDGFNDSQLSDDTFSVTFEGNGYTSDARARDFMLLRCADLTLEHGKKFFRLVGAADGSKNGAAMVMNGNAAFVAPIHFPSTSAMIQIRADKGGPQDFDATIVGTSMRSKYGMQQIRHAANTACSKYGIK